MIYFFDNYASLDLSKAEELLPADRYERFCRLRQTRDKENCLAAYLLTKKVLKEQGIDSFTIVKDENGKPHLENSNLHFNISHCKFGVVVAVSSCPVGVDIQDLTEYSEGIAKRVFTDNEVDLVEKSKNKDRAFTEIWTLKEAAAKCDGRGISVLRDFSFEESTDKFTKYNRNFRTWERKNLFVSVCGNEDFSDIIEIKSLEVF